jgi:hypothetical protein
MKAGVLKISTGQKRSECGAVIGTGCEISEDC